jgi:hypothetical protein
MERLGLGIAVVLGGTAFLHMFYRAVEFRWPESYVGAGDAGLYRILGSPKRYIAFRVLPVYATSLFVAVTASNAGLSATGAALGVAAVHGTVTTGRAIVRDIRAPRPLLRHRLPFLFVRVMGFVGLIAAGFVAAYSVPLAEPIVPPPSELSTTLWTAVLAGVTGAYVVRLTSDRSTDVHDLIKASHASITPGHWRMAGEVAQRCGADSDLLRAIMLVENLQRPAWIRRLESIKGRFFPAGTYGVMQIAASHPLSDEESIASAAHRIAGTSILDDSGYVNSEAVSQAARTYNPDPAYPQLLVAAVLYVRERH